MPSTLPVPGVAGCQACTPSPLQTPGRSRGSAPLPLPSPSRAHSRWPLTRSLVGAVQGGAGDQPCAVHLPSPPEVGNIYSRQHRPGSALQTPRKLIALFPAFVVQNCNSSRRCKELCTAVRGGTNRSKLCKGTLRPDLRKTFVYRSRAGWNKEQLSDSQHAGRGRAGGETTWTALHGAGRCCQSPQQLPSPPKPERGAVSGCREARRASLCPSQSLWNHIPFSVFHVTTLFLCSENIKHHCNT